MKCKSCGAESIEITANVPAPHHSRIECSSCGRFLGWGKAPWTFERAAAFKIGFGKWRGKALSEIDEEKDGRSWIEWGVKNLDKNPQIACETYLKLFGIPGSACRWSNIELATDIFFEAGGAGAIIYWQSPIGGDAQAETSTVVISEYVPFLLRAVTYLAAQAVTEDMMESGEDFHARPRRTT